MQEFRSQLDPERANAMDAILAGQARESFEWIQKLDNQLTHTNFLTNGGAAVAVLAFLGTGHSHAVLGLSLGCFTLGVVATGLELRGLLQYFADLHKDAARRRRGFLNDELRVADLGVDPDIGKWAKRINHWAGWLAQGAFIGGVLVAAFAFWSSLSAVDTPQLAAQGD